MGIQSFFKQRRPRQFEHKPIYWDPKKEELAQRIARVERELDQELSPSSDRVAEEAPDAGAQGGDQTPSLRGSFAQSTRHLKRQQKQGLTSSEQDQRMIRLVIALLALGLAFWYFYLR